MSAEATISVSLSFAKSPIPTRSLSVSSISQDVAGTSYVNQVQTVPTTAGGTAINLGAVTNPGLFLIKNLDATNYVQILNAVSGTVMLKINPGQAALGYFDAGVTAPAALAHTAAVQIEYLILPV